MSSQGCFFIISEKTSSFDNRNIVVSKQFFESGLHINFLKYKRVPWMIRKGSASARTIYKRSVSTPNIDFLVQFLKAPFPFLLEKEDHRGWFNSLRKDLHYIGGRIEYR